MTEQVGAIRIAGHGGPEVMRWEQVEVGAPGPAEVRLRHTAVGLNYIDANQRSGAYPLKSFPAVLGMEGAGVVEAVGADVADFREGDRVAYCMDMGSYSEKRVIAARSLIAVPDGISDETAAAVTLQGLTAHYLVRLLHDVKPGETVLVQAAAGGVGLILCQWCQHLGATVLGTVGSAEKAELARAHGCDHPILYRDTDFVAAARELTDGRGVDVIFDAVGAETFEKGLGLLADRGHMLSYGQSSGPTPLIDIAPLAARSLTISRGGLFTFAKDPVQRGGYAAELFDLVARGVIKVAINQRYPLQEAAQAHADLEARRTTGSTVFTV